MSDEETHRIAHEKAVRELTAESYLLGDLSDAEATAFELHFFDCPVCADTIRAGAAMFAAGREVAKSDAVNPQPVPPRVLPFKSKAQQWMSLAAAAVIAFVLGNIFPLLPRVAPAVSAIEVVPQGETFRGVMRSAGADATVHIDGKRSRTHLVEITDRSFPRYGIELRDAQDKVVASTSATAEEVRSSDEGISLLIRPLPAGRYVLVIEGVREDGNRSPIDRFGVVVQ